MLLKKMARDTESIIAVCFIVVSVLFFVGGRNPLLTKSMTDKYSPAFFPNIFASLLLFFSVCILVGRYKVYSEESGKAPNADKTPQKLLLLFCLTIICPVLMSYGGFILMGLLSIFIFSKILSLSTKESSFLSLGLTIGIYLLFNTLLKVQLPKGIFF